MVKLATDISEHLDMHVCSKYLNVFWQGFCPKSDRNVLETQMLLQRQKQNTLGHRACTPQTSLL